MADPRRPQNVKFFKPDDFPKQEEGGMADFFQLVSFAFSMAAFFLKVKWTCWAALFFFVISYFNLSLDKRLEKVITGSGMIVVSFLSVYIQAPALAAAQAVQQSGLQVGMSS